MRFGGQLLQLPGVNLLIRHLLADHLSDLSSDLCEGVFCLAIQRIDFALVLFRREQNVGNDARLILGGNGSMFSRSKW